MALELVTALLELLITLSLVTLSLELLITPLLELLATALIDEALLEPVSVAVQPAITQMATTTKPSIFPMMASLIVYRLLFIDLRPLHESLSQLQVAMKIQKRINTSSL
jgi:hypothetical protein